MGDKFNTVNSKLFTNNNPSRLPKWMEDFRDNAEDIINNKKSIEIEFDKKGKFQEKTYGERPELDSSLRKIEAGYNENRMIIESKIELAKFLKGKYYKTTTKTAGNKAYLNTTIDGLQANFCFEYEFENGKIKQAQSFTVNDAEYPFNKAGFEESIQDLKNGELKKSVQKVASSRGFIINREDIIRRYNGQIRLATNAIEKYLNDGTIVGVSSNSYGTFYDPDELFPQLQKEIPQDKLGSFEYVDNIEHVATNEVKSNKNLSIEASNILGSIFNDYIISHYSRDNDEFLVTAKVLGNSGKICDVNFNFNIKNEKIASLVLAEYEDKRMSIDDLLKSINSNKLNNKLLNDKVASRIYKGTIISKKELSNKLAKLINKSEIDNFINGLVELGELNQINSTTYSSTTTIDDLINKMNFEKMSDEELNNLISLGKKYSNEIERYESTEYLLNDSKQKDTKERMIFSANNYLSKHFSSFNSKTSNVKDNILNYEIELFDDESGLKNNIQLKLSFENNKIASCNAVINGKEIPIEEVKKVFAKNEILSRYLSENKNKKENSSMIITKQALIRKLKNIAKLEDDDIDNTINNWLKFGKIDEISKNVFASKNTFEQLLSQSNLKALSDEEIIDKLLKSKKNKELRLTAEYINDSDTRDMEEKWSSQSKALHGKVQISSMFKDFSIVDAEDNIDNYTLTAKIINPCNGLKQGLKFKFASNNNKIGDIIEISNGVKSVKPENIMELLETNKAVDKFASLNSTSNSDKIIISKSDLKNKLLPIVGYNNVDKSIRELVASNMINNLNESTFYSENSLSEIVRYLSENNIANIKEAENFMKDNYNKNLSVDLRGKTVYDTDNRKLEHKEEKLSPKMKQTADKISALVNNSLKNKKITANKKKYLDDKLAIAKTPNDLEMIWRELKKYL